MATLKSMIAQIRMDGHVADNAAVKYSDYQIISAINGALDGIYVIIAGYTSDLTIKSKTLTANSNGEAKLPSDFVSVYEVFGGGAELTPASKSDSVTDKNYKIRGNKIITGCGQITLEYKYCPLDLTAEDKDNEMPLPVYFNSLIKAYAVGILTGQQTDTSLAQSVLNIVQQRAYNKLVTHTSTGGWN